MKELNSFLKAMESLDTIICEMSEQIIKNEVVLGIESDVEND